MRHERDHDVAIIGQGLAGSCLAWALRDRGQRVLIVDPGIGPSASRVAAGLVTPITGQRLTAAATSDELKAVVRFYRRIERETGIDMLHVGASIRLFADAGERELWSRRSAQPEIAVHLTGEALDLPADQVMVAHGGFAMRAARLDTRAFLAATRQHFDVVAARVDWQHDVVVGSDALLITGRRVGVAVACEGWTGSANPFFPNIAMAGSRGDILTVRFAVPPADRTLHRGIWIAPTQDGLHRVGATFSWSDLDQGPLLAARAQLEAAVRAFVHVPFDVVAHDAGVRPVAKRRTVLMGRSSIDPRIALFNGLGAKGTVRAALYATRLAAHLVDGTPVPPEFDVRGVPA